MRTAMAELLLAAAGRWSRVAQRPSARPERAPARRSVQGGGLDAGGAGVSLVEDQVQDRSTASRLASPAGRANGPQTRRSWSRTTDGGEIPSPWRSGSYSFTTKPRSPRRSAASTMCARRRSKGSGRVVGVGGGDPDIGDRGQVGYEHFSGSPARSVGEVNAVAGSGREDVSAACEGLARLLGSRRRSRCGLGKVGARGAPDLRAGRARRRAPTVPASDSRNRATGAVTTCAHSGYGSSCSGCGER
jgi:hypothetical protein